MSTAIQSAQELLLSALDKSFTPDPIQTTTWTKLVRPHVITLLDEMRARERRDTVERIRARLNPGFQGEVFMLVGAENTSLIRTETILSILDDEVPA